MDLRVRIVALRRAGATCREVAEQFMAAPSTVWKLEKRANGKGSPAPRQMGGHRKRLPEEEAGWIGEQVEACPDTASKRLREELFRERGISVGGDTVRRFVRRLGFTPKKTMAASEQDLERVKHCREEWENSQGNLDRDRLVFVDGTGIKTSMAPLRGWAPKGKRLKGKAPFGHWNTSTLVAGLRSSGIAAHRTVSGPINGKAFLEFVREDLAPALKPGDLAVMDNPDCRKSAAVREAIREKGAEVRFLPPCSPDFNPIEQVFAKLKHWLRNARERDPAKLRKRASGILEGIEPGECANYIRHAGYCST